MAEPYDRYHDPEPDDEEVDVAKLILVELARRALRASRSYRWSVKKRGLHHPTTDIAYAEFRTAWDCFAIAKMIHRRSQDFIFSADKNGMDAVVRYLMKSTHVD